MRRIGDLAKAHGYGGAARTRLLRQKEEKQIARRIRGRRIGQNIRERRKTLDLDQGDLATRLGVSQPVVSQWEKETEDFKAPTLIKLALALDCTIEDLFRYTDANYDRLREAHSLAVVPDLDGLDRDLLTAFRALTPEDKTMALRMIQSIASTRGSDRLQEERRQEKRRKEDLGPPGRLAAGQG